MSIATEHGRVQSGNGRLREQDRPPRRGEVRERIAQPQTGLRKKVVLGLLIAVGATLVLAAVASLTFEPPDPDRFPPLRLARESLRAGGSAPNILNAANEVAVAAFLEERIGFSDIAAVVEEALAATPARPLDSLDVVFAVDDEARRRAAAIIDCRLTAAR